MLNSDLIELLQILNENQTKYIIVGVYAVIQYTEPRYTKVLEIWVDSSVENSKKVWKSLVEFGAPLDNVNIRDFQNEENVFQLGIEPNRVDVLMGLENLIFNEAWKSSKYFELESDQVKVLNIDDLITSKKNNGRLQDELILNVLRKQKI